MTVAVRHGRQVIAIWPGFRDLMLGVAFDVGSTTIAGHLCDLTTGAVLASAGRMNPQIGFGEDLMSRVSYVMMNEGGEAKLTAVVREAINGLIGDLVAEAEVDRNDVLEVTVVGQPDHASPGSGLRPPGVGDGAVRSGHRLGPRHPRRAVRTRCPSRERWSTPSADRRSCRGGCHRRDPLGRAASPGGGAVAGRCRHQRRDRPR